MPLRRMLSASTSRRSSRWLPPTISPISGDEDVHGGDGLAVVVSTHVERLEVEGEVGDDHGPLEYLLGEIPLVLGLQIVSPTRRELERLVRLRQEIDGLAVCDSFEAAVGDCRQCVEQRVVDPLVEELEVGQVVVEHIPDEVLDVVLREIAVVVDVSERDLGLDHPELGKVSSGVGVLRAERRAERVHPVDGEGVGLCAELAAHREESRLSEEVLRVVDGSVVGAWRGRRVECRDPEHLADSLSVTRCDQRRVQIEEVAVLEELVCRV